MRAVFDRKQNREAYKRAKIRQYFTPVRGPDPLKVGAGGLLCLAAALGFSLFGLPSWSDLVAVLAAIVLFAVAWVAFNERAGRASDEEIDAWRDEDFDRVVEEVSEDAALNGADLIDPDNPIVFYGLPRFKNLKVSHNRDDGSLSQRWTFKVAVGEDGVTRFTPPCLTVLHFSKDHLFAYQCDLDLFSGERLNETIDEYFWQDIATLQIEKQTLPADSGEAPLYDQWSEDMPEEMAERYAALHSEEPAVLPTGKRTILRLKTNAGGGLEITVADERFVDNPDADSLQARNAAAITRLRKLLRERKARR